VKSSKAPGRRLHVRKSRSKLKILFVCTGNACRSQLAEGWCRFFWEDRIEACSAGVSPHGFVDPRIIKVMAEAGVDISAQRSKDLKEYDGTQFDWVITLCKYASKACPAFPDKTKVLHAGFDAPPQLASRSKSEEEALVHYRNVRDAIKAFIETLPGLIAQDKGLAGK
jgi:arsenate reductase